VDIVMDKPRQVERWKMYRANFFNFWYYPNQELVFRDGCAVLRGHNGSGKSVTTQSLITILLDGDVSNRQLDPFGGRERTIADTVLGEEELLGLKQRIGYVSLEFIKEKGNRTKTIGMGVYADREKKKAGVWYFIISGKKVGSDINDLKLYYEEVIEGEVRKIPLEEKDLRERIEQELHCGKVYKDRNEYALAVNQQLFGFENLESYKGLVGLLTQARSPKLSDQNKPDNAAIVLSDSLPVLSEDEIRPLTSSIEAIDMLEKDLLSYKADYKSIKRLSEVYDKYNKIALTEKADMFLRSYKQYEKTKFRLSETKQLLNKNKSDLENAKDDFKRIDSELEVAKQEMDNLGNNEIHMLHNKATDAKKKIKVLSERMKNLDIKRENANKRYEQAKKDAGIYETKEIESERDLQGFIEEIKTTAQEMKYEQHTRFYEHFVSNQAEENYAFKSWETSINEYMKLVEKIRDKLKDFESHNFQLQEYKSTLDDIRIKIDKAQLEIDKIYEQYEQGINEVRESIQCWDSKSKILCIPDNILDELYLNVENVFDTLSIEEYTIELVQHVTNQKAEIQKGIYEKEWYIQQKNKDLKTLEKDIEDWKNKLEIEPDFVLTKKEAWVQLAETGISFKPFYEAFEFRKDVGDGDRIKIQNALYAAGILSSVVTDRSSVAEAATFTTALKYQSYKSHNLSEVLVSVEGDSYDELLKGIEFTETKEGYILQDGTYQTNFTRGKAALFHKSLFIGKASREAYRLQEISKLESLYDKVKVDLKQKIVEKKEQQELVELIAAQFVDFPEIGLLQELLQDISIEKSRIDEVFQPEIDGKMLHITEINKKLGVIMSDIRNDTIDLSIPLKTRAFNTELQTINNYKECLLDLRNSHKDARDAFKHALNYLSQAEAEKQHMDGYDLDYFDTQRKKSNAQLVLDGLNRMLTDLDSIKTLERLDELTNLINIELPTKRDELLQKRTTLKNSISESKEEIGEIESENVPFDKMIYEAWELVFREQTNLGFVWIDEKIMDLHQKAQFVVNANEALIDKDRKEIKKSESLLHNQFRNQMVELLNYDLKMETKESEYAPRFDTADEAQISMLNAVREQMSRIVITMELEDARIPPSNAVDRLAFRIEQLETEASEKDRELYEEILINTLGENIRRKIQYVEQWEKEMNKFMEHKNLIKFRIRWVAKTSDKEGEINTQRLVNALKKDSRWIDVKEISTHFRSKIMEAKRKYDNENEANLQEVMKEVLDYRKWFNFEIYFTKINGKEIRLNIKSYGQLSGGQRVLAMVTPVLAALYAKYLEGNDDAPRLFTLDEAFARVDDDNINAMFEYIHKLDFNYILNSQSLWGCFGSVPSLSIYELARPNNAPYVSIQSYYWNGNSLTRLNEIAVEEREEFKHVLTT
jgi:uncharacterized protein (TIGR02680 family)